MSFSTMGIRKETLGRISGQTSLPGDEYSVHSLEDSTTHSRIRPRNSKSANEKVVHSNQSIVKCYHFVGHVLQIV